MGGGWGNEYGVRTKSPVAIWQASSILEGRNCKDSKMATTTVGCTCQDKNNIKIDGMWSRRRH